MTQNTPSADHINFRSRESVEARFFRIIRWTTYTFAFALVCHGLRGVCCSISPPPLVGPARMLLRVRNSKN